MKLSIEQLVARMQELSEQGKAVATPDYIVVMLPSVFREITRLMPKLRRRYHIVNALNRTKEQRRERSS